MILKGCSRKMQKTLHLCVTLLSLVIIFFYMYIHWSPIHVDDDKQGIEKQFVSRRVLPAAGDVMKTGNKVIPEYEPKVEHIQLEKSFVRKILTKSSYPITLTSPYRIENPDVCTGVNVTLLLLVHTAIAFIHRRQGIRQTFGNKYIFKTINTRVVFLLGVTADPAKEKLIQDENSKYGDIVQGEFMDTYRNLTLKGVMGFRWITEHCSHAKLIVKLDDDFYIDVFRLVEVYVPQLANKTKQIVCNPMYPSPILREKGKWQVDGDYFRGVKVYPRYCSGFTVLMTPDAVRTMYHAAFITPFFWVDDVYLFGLLPSKQNINFTKFTDYSLKLDVCWKAYASPEPTIYVSCGVKKEKLRKMMWKQTLSKLSESLQRTVNDDVLALISNDSETIKTTHGS